MGHGMNGFLDEWMNGYELKIRNHPTIHEPNHPNNIIMEE